MRQSDRQSGGLGVQRVGRTCFRFVDDKIAEHWANRHEVGSLCGGRCDPWLGTLELRPEGGKRTVLLLTRLEATVKMFAAARPFACLALATGGLFAAASPALAAPAVHFDESAVGDVFRCGTDNYTVTAGTKKFVLREGTSTSGNRNFIAVIGADNVILTDENGDTYRLRGIVQDNEHSSQQRGKTDTFVAHLNIVNEKGGVVGRVSVTAHINYDTGTGFFRDTGTCALP
jgi:hypothetical protein